MENKIELLRKRAKMSRKQFAEFFGIPYRSVQNWELGQRQCPSYILDLMEYKLVKEKIIAEK